jgi:hypothetical protein
MRPYSKLVDLARQHGWTFDGRTHYEYQITILRRDRRIRLTAVPAMRTGHDLEVCVETPPPGLPRFTIDHEHHVHSSEPYELRDVWTYQRGQLAKERLAGMTADATHERLIVEIHREVLRDAVIADALELALDLAHAEVYGLASLRRLPEAVVAQTDGPHVELPGPAPIVIRPVRDDARVFTKAAMQCAHSTLPPSTPALGNATVAREGNLVTISWPTIEEDPVRLMAAVELLRTLSSGPHDGAYR